jgi:hypothetical protein
MIADAYVGVGKGLASIWAKREENGIHLLDVAGCQRLARDIPSSELDTHDSSPSFWFWADL